jgi:hypothetical protein
LRRRAQLLALLKAQTARARHEQWHKRTAASKEEAAQCQRLLAEREAALELRLREQSQRLSNRHGIHIDTERRVCLAIMLMIYQQDRDGRAKTLPPYDREWPTGCTSALNADDLLIYTGVFTNIDAVCFPVAKENQGRVNLETVDRVYQASALAGEFLNDSRKMLLNMTRNVISQLNSIHNVVAREQSKIREMHDSSAAVLQQFREIAAFAKKYDASMFQLRMHGYGVSASFVLSLVIPKVFVPTISLTAIFLFLEGQFRNIPSAIVTVGYGVIFAVIHAAAIWRLFRRRRHRHRRVE